MDDDNALSEPIGPQDHSLGPETAPVTLLEYGDYQCSYCGDAFPVLKNVQAKLGNKLRFVFRNFPMTKMHPQAFIAAEAAEAASAQGRFWQMHDKLYQNQDDLTPEGLATYADQLGLDMDRFLNDLKEGVYKSRIRHDFQTGVMSGVNGTPSLYIQGTRYDGPLDERNLIAYLKSCL